MGQSTIAVATAAAEALDLVDAPTLLAAGSELLGLVLGTGGRTLSGGKFTSSTSGSSGSCSVRPSQLAAWYSMTLFAKFLLQSGH